MLKRPYAGRLVSGVAIGFAERYGLPVFLVRIFLVVAIVAAPLVLLAYLLFALSIPDERKVVSDLCELRTSPVLTPREQFESMTTLLVQRLRSRRGGATTFIAIMLLVLAAILELPHVEGPAFYWMHPVLTSVAGIVPSAASLVFYLTAAALFLLSRRHVEGTVVWNLEPRNAFVPDRSGQIVGGIASGISRVLLLDAAYIRVIWIALNILTLGLAGVLYLLLWFFERKRVQPTPAVDVTIDQGATNPAHPLAWSIRVAVALLLVFLGFIFAATQTRLFFFNQQFFEGLVFAGIGLLLVWKGIQDSREPATTLSLFGTSVFLVGVYFFASALGHFQVDSIDRFEIAELIVAIGFGFLALAVLTSHARTIALYFALAIAVGAAMIAFHIAKPEYLAAVIRFYDFFYPIIFAALGLWVTFEP